MTRIGLYASGLQWSFDELKEVWKEADRLGFDSAHIMDNVVGPVPRQPELPVFETFAVLPVLAEITERIRFGPLVTPSGRRHPALFAKMTSVLDSISGGRLILAMGCGDEERHFVPWGMPFPKASERIATLVEEIEVIKRMWTEQHASYDGLRFRLDRAINNPKPIQQPHPPIWVGLNFGRKLMPRVAARHANGFNVYIGPDERAKELCDIVHRFCAEEGRSYDELDRSRHLLVTFTDEEMNFDQLVQEQAKAMGLAEDYLREHYQRYVRLIWGTPEKIITQLKRQVELGFNYVVVQFQGLHDASLGGDFDSAYRSLSIFAKGVMPAIRHAEAE